ncbi:MAG TPA: PHP domain-containing protein [Vicinamibacterales bacterium]|nr:PHP domain-containing protein [Vicinamibacterales bacterium]
MSVSTLPDVIRQLACLAEVRGVNDAVELRLAVPVLDRLRPADLADLVQRARGDQLPEFPGLSPAAVRRLTAVAAGGEDAALAAARARIPTLLRRLLETGTITHEQAAMLARELGVATLPDLQSAIDDGRILRAFGSTAERLMQAAAVFATELRPIPLGRACETLGAVTELIAAHCPAVDEVVIAGDARRYEPLVSALVLVAVTSDPPAALDALAAASGVDDVLHRTGRRAIIVIRQTEVDVRVAAPDDFGTVLFAATGSREHVRAVSSRRHRPELCAREADIYAHSGLAWIPPEVRNGSGEIEAAASGRLPQLVERRDVRGDLHLHSTYSDGQDTMETMIAAAEAIGYEYVAITDHSERTAAARTVTLDQLARQREEIERLRERHPHIAILHGLEVEILPDGRLDFSDAVLEQLDIVLASLHDAARHDGATLTRRCLRAIRHPLVNVITHPANRLVGRRGGYPLDYEAIYAAAAETGTALEIDGAPSHLDLDGEHARAAVRAGVTVTIDSDCHRARSLDRQMHLGIGTARRGWVEARHVLNARPLEEVRAFIQAKRRI